jgi:hypothetical protein
MLDVDDNGWIHVAYYQNEDGVVNASEANVYYTLSKDGGMTWIPHVQVNGVADRLDYQNPPPDRASVAYYLIGDYCQIKASGAGSATRRHVFWTGYDKDRSNATINNKRERVICTSLIKESSPIPTLSGWGLVVLTMLLVSAAAYTLRKRATAST